MKRIEKALQKIKEKNQIAFVPYIMAGDGGLESLMEKILFLEKSGATAVEIGIPFSDPVADGPTIQEAGIRALKEGITLRDVLKVVAKLRPITSIPLIIMTYMNPIYAYGIKNFIEDACQSGVDGCIIPDLPIEEENAIEPQMLESGIDLIRLVTLTSPLERIKEIAAKGSGFLYAVTVTGTTGERRTFNEEVGQYLRAIKEVSSIPVLAGFGISTQEHIKTMGQYCDGVIVGSKIVDLFHKNEKEEIKQLIEATKMIPIQ